MISISGVAAGALVGRLDKAMARRIKEARTHTSINKKEGFIQCKAKATSGLQSKQVVRDVIGTLMETLNEVTIL